MKILQLCENYRDLPFSNFGLLDLIGSGLVKSTDESLIGHQLFLKGCDENSSQALARIVTCEYLHDNRYAQFDSPPKIGGHINIGKL